MSKSVRKDGTVCGPAPRIESARIIELPVRQNENTGDAGVSAVPVISDPDCSSDAAIEVARAALSNAIKSQRHLEGRLDRVSTSLLVTGESIPTLDQTDLSMLQEAYINASTAYRVASDKALIWQLRVNRLAAQQGPGRPNSTGDLPLAA